MDAKEFFDYVVGYNTATDPNVCWFYNKTCVKKPRTFFDCESDPKSDVMLIVIQTEQCGKESFNTHYNLLVKRNGTYYLFEPAKDNRDVTSQLLAFLDVHFGKVSVISVHPQGDDKYCMAYICMFALAFLNDKRNRNVKRIAAKATQNQDPQIWYRSLQADTQNYPELPSLPLGHTDHNDDHHTKLKHVLDPLGVFDKHTYEHH